MTVHFRNTARSQGVKHGSTWVLQVNQPIRTRLSAFPNRLAQTIFYLLLRPFLKRHRVIHFETYCLQLWLVTTWPRNSDCPTYQTVNPLFWQPFIRPRLSTWVDIFWENLCKIYPNCHYRLFMHGLGPLNKNLTTLPYLTDVLGP